MFNCAAISFIENPFSRKEITNYLENSGVETRPIVAGNIARHPVGDLFEELKEYTFPGADAVHERGFYIGLSPFHSDEIMDKLLESISTPRRPGAA